jgi:hypothetical protein
MEEILPFENLRNDKERQRYLICTGEVIIGLTTQEVLSKGPKLRKLYGFTFDTLAMTSA